MAECYSERRAEDGVLQKSTPWPLGGWRLRDGLTWNQVHIAGKLYKCQFREKVCRAEERGVTAMLEGKKWEERASGVGLSASQTSMLLSK